MYYVIVDSLNGRNEYADFALWVMQREIEVEYFPGGWMDKVVEGVWPHLRFENREDALAYVLAKGGEVLTEIPKRV